MALGHTTRIAARATVFAAPPSADAPLNSVDKVFMCFEEYSPRKLAEALYLDPNVVEDTELRAQPSFNVGVQDVP